jgi:phenylalanyl-tRNA synthetase beta chain
LEEKQIAGLIVLPKKDSNEPFYEIRDDLQALLDHFRVTAVQFRRAQKLMPYAHPNRHASWFDFKTQQEIIHLFELHPLVAKNFGLDKVKVACFEINYSLFNKLTRAEIKYKPISRFPGIEFDVSVLIKRESEVAEIIKTIQKTDQALIKNVTLFDYYQGENIPADKKSLAFKILLQSAERTLTDEEMKSAQNRVFQNLQKIGGEIRGL